jgi:hypothetical protein
MCSAARSVSTSLVSVRIAWAMRSRLIVPMVPAVFSPRFSSPVTPNGTERALVIDIDTLPMVCAGVSAG